MNQMIEAVEGDWKGMRRGDQSLESTKPMTTKIIVEGGVTTQYDQKIVRLMRRSKASPEAACVIYETIRWKLVRAKR